MNRSLTITALGGVAAGFCLLSAGGAHCQSGRTCFRKTNLFKIVLLALIAFSGCAHYQEENPALTQYPGIKSQIENFYDANATEDDWTCDSPEINTIVKSQVASQSAIQVKVAVTYAFQSSILQGRDAQACQGFNTRFFTFDKGPGGQLSLSSMTGPQREVNG